MSIEPTHADNWYLNTIPAVISQVLPEDTGLSDREMLVLQTVCFIHMRQHMYTHNIPREGWSVRRRTRWVQHFGEVLRNCLTATHMYLIAGKADLSVQEEE